MSFLLSHGMAVSKKKIFRVMDMHLQLTFYPILFLSQEIVPVATLKILCLIVTL